MRWYFTNHWEWTDLLDEIGGFHWGNMVIWWGLGISFFAEGSRQIIPVTSLGCRHTDLDKLWQLVFSEGLLVGENQWKAHRILDVGKVGGYLGTPLELGWCLLWPAHGDSDLVATAAPRKPALWRQVLRDDERAAGPRIRKRTWWFKHQWWDTLYIYTRIYDIWVQVKL